MKINVPDSLYDQARQKISTSVGFVLRKHLHDIVGDDPIETDPLFAFSQGLLTRQDAVEKLGLRDYAQLLIFLGNADLPLPVSEHVEEEAALIERLWREKGKLVIPDAGPFNSMAKPPFVHLLSTIGFVRGLERAGLIESADDIISEMTKPSDTQKQARAFGDLDGFDEAAAIGSRWL